MPFYAGLLSTSAVPALILYGQFEFRRELLFARQHFVIAGVPLSRRCEMVFLAQRLAQAIPMTIDELKTDMDARFSHVDRRFEALADLISQGFARMDERFEAMNTRFDTQGTPLGPPRRLLADRKPLEQEDGRVGGAD